ncbi:Na(+)-translocating NADH-quinone reductase subunit F [Gillisia sp. Hel_I_86]|uniref:Na(+)-translocating NADH-quinone reductase subunit F n=1 Tax=Gillisia sp. Hel_I_86 TaxID=1249981 RepID=UPI0011A77D5C|nr:Na(+)-translocating NADH-quinone reductase subunit F [Gillisia sp. Hel_I_86]
MKEQLTDQELHNLAMNIVGKELEDDGYEFLGVNSQLKRNPQFVALKEKKLNFVIVRAIPYPVDPKYYDPWFMKEIKEHALKFNAKTYYAGVGIANSEDYDKPVLKDEKYIVNYEGLQEI